MENCADWNSLEVAKLVIPVITTILFGVFALWLEARFFHKLEDARWFSHKIIEQRLQVFESVAPALNDLLCYFQRVGNWKELTPRQLLEHKRKLDKQMHVFAPLYSAQLLQHYKQFIALCFVTYTGEGQDAKLRLGSEKYQQTPSWQAEYATLFCTPDQCAPVADVSAAYELLMADFAKELGLNQTH